MNFTLVTLRANGDNFIADYGREGTNYFISIYDKESGEHRTRLFPEAKDAEFKFCEIAKWCCTGNYSFIKRCQRLFE